MTLSANIQSLAIRVATEFKATRQVTTKLRTDLDALGDEIGPASGLDDSTTSTATAWSSSKTNAAIQAAVAALVASAPEALDTLKELADALGSQGDAAATLVARVSTLEGKVGDTDTNFVTAFEGALA